MTGDNEVSFAITDPLSFLDIYWSFVDHMLVGDLFSRLSLASPPVVELVSVSFDTSAVGTFDVVSDSHT